MGTLEDDIFFDSELSELTEDEDDYGGEYIPRNSKSSKSVVKEKRPTPKKGATVKEENGYVVSDVLRPPRSTQYSVRSLYEQLSDGHINLDPDYQRDVVWTETKQVGLIDSVFRNYYIPPIIFAVSTADDGTETRTCIDGKQRLTSINKFLDGLIPHRDSVTGKKYWFKKKLSTPRAHLPKPMQTLFLNKQVACMEYQEINGDQEREIFQRVQLGVALTPAERMQAISSPRANLVREMMDRVLGVDGFGEALDWGRARGRDFQGVASIIYLIELLPDHKCPASASLETWLNKSEDVSAELRTSISQTLQIFLVLTHKPEFNTVFHKPTVSPVEFIMIGVLIHRHKGTFTLKQLTSAIEAMRTDIRKREKDVRTNTRISKHLHSCINTFRSKQFAMDESDKAPAVRSISAPCLDKERKMKRQRPINDEESIDELDSTSSDEEPLHGTLPKVPLETALDRIRKRSKKPTVHPTTPAQFDKPFGGRGFKKKPKLDLSLVSAVKKVPLRIVPARPPLPSSVLKPTPGASPSVPKPTPVASPSVPFVKREPEQDTSNLLQSSSLQNGTPVRMVDADTLMQVLQRAGIQVATPATPQASGINNALTNGSTDAKPNPTNTIPSQGSFVQQAYQPSMNPACAQAESAPTMQSNQQQPSSSAAPNTPSTLPPPMPPAAPPPSLPTVPPPPLPPVPPPALPPAPLNPQSAPPVFASRDPRVRPPDAPSSTFPERPAFVIPLPNGVNSGKAAPPTMPASMAALAGASSSSIEQNRHQLPAKPDLLPDDNLKPSISRMPKLSKLPPKRAPTMDDRSISSSSHGSARRYSWERDRDRDRGRGRMEFDRDHSDRRPHAPGYRFVGRDHGFRDGGHDYRSSRGRSRSRSPSVSPHRRRNYPYDRLDEFEKLGR